MRRTHRPILLTVEEAARSLRLSRTKTYELVMSGQLQSITIGRSRRIPASALATFVEEQS